MRRKEKPTMPSTSSREETELRVVEGDPQAVQGSAYSLGSGN